MGRRDEQTLPQRMLANKHLEKCSLIFMIRKMQIKRPIMYYLIPMRMAYIS